MRPVVLFLMMAFVLLLVPFSYASGFEAQHLRQFGPNLRHGFSGNAPLVWGSWVPQAEAQMEFNWYEPLTSSRYGSRVLDTSRYLRAQGGLALSPFYGEIRAALGAALFRANPQVEIRFVYSNMVYFGSNVEMAMGDRAEERKISKTWNADYVFDRIYDRKAIDQIQSFGFWLDLNLVVKGLPIWNSFRYSLLDINTSYDGKSYDYSRGLPVYSRDFVFEAQSSVALDVAEHWDWLIDLSFYSTGYLRDPSGTYAKESLAFYKIMMGPSWHWNHGRSRLSFIPGFWHRIQKHSFEGSVWEQFIFQLNYQSTWHLPFVKKEK